MSEEMQDAAPEVEVETKPETKDVKAEEKADEVEPSVNEEVADEPVEESPEEKLKRLEELEERSQATQKKLAAQRKHIASLQKAKQEADAKLNEYIQARQAEENVEPQKPVVDDFDTFEDYQKAQDKYVDDLAEYRAKETVKTERQKQLEEEAKAAQMKAAAERSKDYEAQKAEYVQINPEYALAEEEFNTYIQDAMQTTNPYVQDAIVNQAYREGNVPALIDYFGGNNGERLEELDAISKMTPPEAAVEIFKIQQSLKKIPEIKKETKLPKPAARVKPTGSGNKPLSKQSGKDVLKWVNS